MSELPSSMECLHPSLSQSVEDVAAEIDKPATSNKDVVDEENKNNGDDAFSLSSDDSEIIMCDDEFDVTVIPGPGHCDIANTSKYVPNVVYSVGDDGSPYIGDVNILRKFVEEHNGLKKVLFRNHFMEPITFLLLLHDFSLELKLSKLIEDCGGKVYNSVRDIDDFTAVLVKDDSIHWAYNGPVFKVSYLSACVQAEKVLDISKFFKSAVKPEFTKEFDYMSVVYFKRRSWNNVPPKFCSPNKVYKNNSRNNTREEIVDVSGDSDDDTLLENDKNDKEVEKKKKVPNKHSRLPYTREEDSNIVKYVVKKKGYNSVKGNDFWKVLEKKAICPQRTWQSMKEHFRRKIIFNLDSFKFLSDEEKYYLSKVYN